MIQAFKLVHYDLLMGSNKILYEQVIQLWELANETFEWSEQDGFLEIILGAHYSKAAIAGDCVLTDSGIEIVKKSKVQMIEILTENLEDFDKSEFE